MTGGEILVLVFLVSRIEYAEAVWLGGSCSVPSNVLVLFFEEHR